MRTRQRQQMMAMRRICSALGLAVASAAWTAVGLLAGGAHASPAYGVERVGGVPRFACDGKPFAATAVMPSPAAKPGSAQEVLKSFRAAGIRLASDVWTMHDKRYTPRQWWLDDGEYDFAQFDALAHGLTDAADDELIFPRIKIDPPAKWSAAHPEEMMDEISPHPESAAWRALYRRMLKDVIEHVEKSDYADRVIGYHIGAFHCGEWLTGEWKSPGHRAYIAPVSCATRDALPPRSSTASRRASLAYRSTAVADMLIDAAACVKECTRGRKLVGAFFGYPSIAHEKLSRVLQSGKVDFVAAPPHYGNFREPGQAGRSQAYYQASYRLHDMVYFEESDFRTFLSEPAFAPPRQTRRRPLDESLALVRRSIGKSLAGGWENWWFMLGGNNTFSDPALMASIRIGAAEAAATLATARWTPAEVAVFTAADEYVTSGRTHVPRMAEWGKCRLHKEVLPVCGVPVDSYELSDIADSRLPDYKVYVFPNAITLSSATRAKIKERVRRAGKTAIWVFAPGYYDEHGEGNVANVEELTGVAVAPRPLTGDHPCDKMLAPVGRAVCDREGWRSVFVSLPPDAAALRAAFREAGAHVWMETDDVLAAGRGYVMVHAASDGEKTIRLPGTFDAREIFGASPARKGASEIVETMKCGETRVWRLGK